MLSSTVRAGDPSGRAVWGLGGCELGSNRRVPVPGSSFDERTLTGESLVRVESGKEDAEEGDSGDSTEADGGTIMDGLSSSCA